MNAQQDLSTAVYAVREAARKAVCVLRSHEGEPLCPDRLAHALGMSLAGMSGLERLLFELVSDAAQDYLTARPVVQAYRKPAMRPTARARAART